MLYAKEGATGEMMTRTDRDHIYDDLLGLNGAPLPLSELAVRPCLRERKALTAARWDLIARYAGRRTPAWIGRCLGLGEQQVVRFMQRHGISPTTRDDLLISSIVADILGCTQQHVVRLIKAHKLCGWRNPGGRWWLCPRESVQRYLKERGQRADDVRLMEPSGWPSVVTRRGWRRCSSR